MLPRLSVTCVACLFTPGLPPYHDRFLRLTQASFSPAMLDVRGGLNLTDFDGRLLNKTMVSMYPCSSVIRWPPGNSTWLPLVTFPD